jgi:ADP-ribose pyrophosphatase
LPLEPDERVEVFHGNLIQVFVETWPQGLWETVHHPGAAAIVSFDGDDVLLIRQLRQPIRSETLEIPAGVLDREGETPAECARRELREETGFGAADEDRLGAIYTSPRFQRRTGRRSRAFCSLGFAGRAAQPARLARIAPLQRVG